MSTKRIALHLLAHNPTVLSVDPRHSNGIAPDIVTLVYRAQCQGLARDVSLKHDERAKRRAVVRRIKLSHGTNGRSETLYNRLRICIKTAQKDLRELILRYVPKWLTHSILPLGIDPDPVHLIECGFPLLHGELRLSRTRLEFEARRSILLGLYYFQIHEAYRRTARNAATRRIVRFLVRNGVFDKPPTPHRITSYYDPARSYRCVAVSELDHRKARADCTAIRTRGHSAHIRSPRGALPVLFFSRDKSPLSFLRRMLVEGEWDPECIPDRYAVRFCYRNKQDLFLGYEQFVGSLLGVYKVKDRYMQNGNLSPNRHSNKHFKDVKCIVRMQGIIVEVQHMTGRAHFNIAYSRTLMNHSLYNVRQMCAMDPPGLLHCVFPQYVYGIDWSSSKMQEAIAAHIFAQLPGRS